MKNWFRPHGIAASGTLLLLWACAEVRPVHDGDLESALARTSSTLDDGGYTVTTYVASDPLYQFVKEGETIRLRSDPDRAGWGDDFWGAWEDPFALDGNSVTYGSLGTVTYDFTPLADGSVDIEKTTVTFSTVYGPSDPTISVSEVGNAELTDDVPEPCPDADGDGEDDIECGGEDCDDSDRSIYTWAYEVCRDGIDQDCDGVDARCDCYTTKGRFRYCK